MDSGEAMTTVRRRLGLTQTGLANHLGVKQNTISQYEAGKASPSIDVLIKLHQLVNNDKEAADKVQELIAARMIISGEQLDSIMNAAGEKFRQALVAQMERLSPADWQAIRQAAVTGWPAPGDSLRSEADRFLDEARRIADSKLEVSQVLTSIVRLYRQHGQSAEIRALFRKALDYLEVEISRRHRRRPG
jgi:transcriptional regulator with XRE-family HTH domain